MIDTDIMRPDKYARIYQRMVTGLQIAKNSNAFMRFMTLTTATTAKRHIKKAFDVLRKRIRRATYEKDGFLGFNFNRYFCLRTTEGHGVLHIIYWGQYIPQTWLSKNWKDIYGASIVDIRKTFSRRRKVNGLVGYLLQRYLSRQPIKRMSYGWKWAWLGFCGSWKKFKEAYGAMRKSQPGSLKLLGAYVLTLTTYCTNGFYRLTSFAVPGLNFQGKYSNQTVTAWQSLLWDPPPTTRQKKLSGSRSLKWHIPELSP